MGDLVHFEVIFVAEVYSLVVFSTETFDVGLKKLNPLFDRDICESIVKLSHIFNFA